MGKFRKERERGQQVTKTGRVGDGKEEQKMGNEVWRMKDGWERR